MKKTILSICIFIMSLTAIHAQKHFTRSGEIFFYSDAPMEKIEAHNNTVTSVIDLENGRMEFAVLIKAFQFEKALMQEHFNENYMESSKFPKASFKGQVQNLSDIDFAKDGTYEADIKGDLTIHGETKNVETKGTFVIKNGQISANSTFIILVADYGIKIPAVVKENIAKEVKIEVLCDYQEFNKGS